MQIIGPVRVERTYTQKLRGKPDDVFPLLCPVREKEWVDGWDPLEIYTHSGFAEKDCVFTTGEENPESIWVITNFDYSRHLLEVVKVTPGMTVARITISLSENETGGTDAEVVYRYTAISPDGEEFVKGYSEEFFRGFMQFSESALNSYLDKRSRDGNGGS
ncbi:MAG: hypothetical protein AB9866_20415 [Syntrophobacteraceae bacterium]